MLPFLVRLEDQNALAVIGTRCRRNESHDDLLGSFGVEGRIRLLRDPDAMEQDGQLTRYSDNCLVPGLLTASRSQMQAPLSKR
jgi:hypothetical protein